MVRKVSGCEKDSLQFADRLDKWLLWVEAKRCLKGSMDLALVGLVVIWGFLEGER